MKEKEFFNSNELLWISNFSRKCGIHDVLIKMILLVEDKRFLRHKGIDFIAILRAMIVNLRYLDIKQGAGTISQQLYNLENRNGLRPVNNGKLHYKLKKILNAIKTESKLTKGDILRTYLEKVYFGKVYFGVHAAVKGYFQCTPNCVSIAQSFFLAERISLPNKARLDRIMRILTRPEIRFYFTKSDFDELMDIYRNIFGVHIFAG